MSVANFLSQYHQWTTLGHQDFRGWWVTFGEETGDLEPVDGRGGVEMATAGATWVANTVMWEGDPDNAPFDRDIHLEYIVVPSNLQGHGIGGEIMGKITELADADEVSITLEPMPKQSQRLDTEALIQWYERYGFEVYDHPDYGLLDEPDETVMIRYPESD
jgi:GNAT superfamily N-acetyltransferase